MGGLVNIDIFAELLLSHLKKNTSDHKLFIQDLFTASTVIYLSNKPANRL